MARILIFERVIGSSKVSIPSKISSYTVPQTLLSLCHEVQHDIGYEKSMSCSTIGLYPLLQMQRHTYSPVTIQHIPAQPQDYPHSTPYYQELITLGIYAIIHCISHPIHVPQYINVQLENYLNTDAQVRISFKPLYTYVCNLSLSYSPVALCINFMTYPISHNVCDN